MSRDTQELLRDAAREPSRQVDPTDLWKRGRRQRRIAQVGGAVLATVALVAAGIAIPRLIPDPHQPPEIAGQPSADPSPTAVPSEERPPSRTTGPAFSGDILARPSEGEQGSARTGGPAAGVCPPPGSEAIVTVAFGPEIPRPRCTRVSGGQRIRFVNESGGANGEWPQRATTIEATFAGWRFRLDPGEDVVLGAPAGTYLEPGVHGVESDYGPARAEIWLVDGSGDELGTGPELDIEALPPLPDVGVAIEQDGNTVLMGLDGTVHGHLPGGFQGFFDLQTRQQPLIDTSGSVYLLGGGVDGARHLASIGLPLRARSRVVHDGADAPADSRLRLLFGEGQETFGSWVEGSPWWVSEDLRAVTWTDCGPERDLSSCATQFYDTDVGGGGELEPGCWVAHIFGDLSMTRICDGGARMVSGLNEQDETTYLAPEGLDAQPTTFAAAFDGGVVRVDHATCDVVEPFIRDEGDVLRPLLGARREANPSAVPLGTLRDGRVVLHLNSAACDAAAQRPGLALFDPDTEQLELVREFQAPHDAVRMWHPLPG